MATIAIDYTPAYEQGGGIGRYVRELVAALALQDSQSSQFSAYRLFVSGAKELPPLPGANFQWRSTRLNPTWMARIWYRARLPLPVEAFVGKVDLYHATDFVLPPACARTLLTVHDLSFVRVPETASPSLKAYLDRVVPRSVKRADHVLADSQATKDDLIALYGAPPEKVTVLLSGVDSRFKRVDDTAVLSGIREKYGIGSAPYIFSIGTVQPRKNYGRLIEALSGLSEQGFDAHLVIAGGRGWLQDPIYETLRQTKMESRVHFIGFASEDDLPALYSAAACFAFPSLYEGFGLPVLEAFACGTPVLTSNVSSLPEVAGDAALLVNPADQEAIIDGLRRLLEDSALRQTLVAKGLARAPQFTWEASARHLRQIYEKLLGQAH